MASMEGCHACSTQAERTQGQTGAGSRPERCITENWAHNTQRPAAIWQLVLDACGVCRALLAVALATRIETQTPVGVCDFSAHLQLTVANTVFRHTGVLTMHCPGYIYSFELRCQCTCVRNGWFGAVISCCACCNWLIVQTIRTNTGGWGKSLGQAVRTQKLG